MLDGLGKLNQACFQRFGDPEIQTRISQYAMAFRMQRSIPELVDISNEPKSVLDLYGPEVTHIVSLLEKAGASGKKSASLPESLASISLFKKSHKVSARALEDFTRLL